MTKAIAGVQHLRQLLNSVPICCSRIRENSDEYGLKSCDSSYGKRLGALPPAARGARSARRPQRSALQKYLL